MVVSLLGSGLGELLIAVIVVGVFWNVGRGNWFVGCWSCCVRELVKGFRNGVVWVWGNRWLLVEWLVGIVRFRMGREIWFSLF